MPPRSKSGKVFLQECRRKLVHWYRHRNTAGILLPRNNYATALCLLCQRLRPTRLPDIEMQHYIVYITELSPSLTTPKRPFTFIGREVAKNGRKIESLESSFTSFLPFSLHPAFNCFCLAHTEPSIRAQSTAEMRKFFFFKVEAFSFPSSWPTWQSEVS